MRKSYLRILTSVFIAGTFLVAGCSASTKVIKTFEDPEYANASYSNYLVIGVAGDYDARVQFENTVASRIRSQGASASAYYSIVRGNEPLARDVVIDEVQKHGFDAVLVTHVVDQQAKISVVSGSAETKASTKGGNAVNFFRYDYEELNEPESINMRTTVVLGTELFSAADEKMIWAIESTIPGVDHVGQLIGKTADAIIDHLAKDRLIRR